MLHGFALHFVQPRGEFVKLLKSPSARRRTPSYEPLRSNITGCVRKPRVLIAV